MKIAKKVFLLLVVLAMLLFNGLLTIQVGQSAIVFNSWNKHEKVLQPGVYFIWPFIESVTYIYMNHRSGLMVLPVKFIDGSTANTSVLVVWHVREPNIYLKMINATQPNELERQLTANVTTVVQNVVGVSSQAVFNSMHNLVVTPTLMQNWGISLDSLTINAITQATVNSASANVESSLASEVVQQSESSSNVVSQTDVATRQLMIESAYYTAQRIKIDTELKELSLYKQIKAKDPKFYYYFRLIDVYRNTATSKADVPSLAHMLK